MQSDYLNVWPLDLVDVKPSFDFSPQLELQEIEVKYEDRYDQTTPLCNASNEPEVTDIQMQVEIDFEAVEGRQSAIPETKALVVNQSNIDLSDPVGFITTQAQNNFKDTSQEVASDNQSHFDLDLDKLLGIVATQNQNQSSSKDDPQKIVTKLEDLGEKRTWKVDLKALLEETYLKESGFEVSKDLPLKPPDVSLNSPGAINQLNNKISNKQGDTVFKRANANIRNYVCESCDYCTTRKAAMMAHKRIHKYFRCIDCGYKTRKSSNLKKHMKRHIIY